MNVAQLVRALDCGSRGRGFESRLSPFFTFRLKFGYLQKPTNKQLNNTFLSTLRYYKKSFDWIYMRKAAVRKCENAYAGNHRREKFILALYSIKVLRPY